MHDAPFNRFDIGFNYISFKRFDACAQITTGGGGDLPCPQVTFFVEFVWFALISGKMSPPGVLYLRFWGNLPCPSKFLAVS